MWNMSFTTRYSPRLCQRRRSWWRYWCQAHLRMAATRKKCHHKFQHLYFWIFYCLLYLYWTTMSDLKYFAGIDRNKPKMTAKRPHRVWGFKLLHYSLFVIPIIQTRRVELAYWLSSSAVAGFILSIVFNPHNGWGIQSFRCLMPLPANLEDEWAIHQLKPQQILPQNRFISWFVGGFDSRWAPFIS